MVGFRHPEKNKSRAGWMNLCDIEFVPAKRFCSDLHVAHFSVVSMGRHFSSVQILQ